MSVDVRKYTRVIVRKNKEYLQCKGGIQNKLMWCSSPWDAWWTRDKEEAMLIAKTTGGIAVLFNSVTGDIAVL